MDPVRNVLPGTPVTWRHRLAVWLVGDVELRRGRLGCTVPEHYEALRTLHRVIAERDQARAEAARTRNLNAHLKQQAADEHVRRLAAEKDAAYWQQQAGEYRQMIRPAREAA